VVRRVAYERMHQIEKRMAIIVPVKDERIRLLEGVLFGIPNACLTIVVSASRREPVDRFAQERRAIESFATFAKKDVLVVHQRDASLAEAFSKGGLPDFLDAEGLLPFGKAEGMAAGIALAAARGREYVGFIDADNYFPGAVHEYVREFSAGFALSESRDTMVRTLWHSKPKIVDSRLFFSRYGRTSVVTNEFLNRLIGYYSGFETEIIRTGNAGEHAMTLPLALDLRLASGYAVEPHHFTELFEARGGLQPDPRANRPVEIFQIESRNPHLHAGRGTEHVATMTAAALGVIRHSSVSPRTLQREARAFASRHRLIARGGELPKPHAYPALAGLDLQRFVESLESAIGIGKLGAA
jgi:mannosyl-3-phosphoglycerate synthase